jgi:hypothetical protein
VLSRRQILSALLGAFSIAIPFWRCKPALDRSSGASQVVLVDGWILLREDLKKAGVDAS